MKQPVFRWKKICTEAAWICVVALTAALLINAVRPDGLSLSYKAPLPHPATDTSGDLSAHATRDEAVVSVETALDLFENKTALFVDARSPEDYEAGHIQGAVNLSILDFGENFGPFFEKVDPQQRIVTYCGDAQCHLAPDLARELKKAGYENVSCFGGGLTVWEENGYPVVR